MIIPVEKPNSFKPNESQVGAIQLCLPDGSPTPGAWLCSACGRVWNDQSGASRCCRCGYCGGHSTWTNGNVAHDECQKKHSARRDEEDLEAAKLIGWDGQPIYYDDKVYDSPESVVENFLPGHAPEFIFATEQHQFYFDLDSALESACDEHHEEMQESLEDVDLLRDAVEAFNAANEGHVTYSEDRKIGRAHV